MKQFPDSSSRIWQLADAVANETISEAELEELQSLLESDVNARNAYLEYCELHADLSFNIQAAQATEDVCAGGRGRRRKGTARPTQTSH